MLQKATYLITRSIFFALIFTSAVLFALISYTVNKAHNYADRIYPNVYINSTPFEGTTPTEVKQYFTLLNNKFTDMSIEIIHEQEIATFSGKMLGLGYDADTIATQAFLIGRGTHQPAKLYQQAATLLRLDTFDLVYTPQYNLTPIDEFLEYLADTYNKDPQDALFEIKNDRVTAFKVEEPGIELDIDSIRETLEKQLATLTPERTVSTITLTVKTRELKPKYTLADSNNLGVVEKIGEGQSNFSGSAPERIHNLTLAASKFHGVLIPPGDIFSYNKIVGDISSSTGFKPGYVIKAGKTVLGDGGGVCQDSTTLFRAALDAGLPIVERRQHGYRVKYYENDSQPGFDATVYAPSVDFKFKNDTGSHILIQSYVDKQNNILRFEFYGKNDGRKVYISDARVWNVRPPPESQYIDDPNLPSGVTKQIDFAAWGAKAAFDYKVELDGKVLQEETFYSNFRPWQAVYLVGTGG